MASWMEAVLVLELGVGLPAAALFRVVAPVESSDLGVGPPVEALFRVVTPA